MKSADQRINVRKAMAIAMTSTTLTCATWACLPQRAVANDTQANDKQVRQAPQNSLSSGTYLSPHRQCEQLAKAQSQLSSLQRDLETDADILRRLQRLYEAGAVSGASYVQQRQVVTINLTEQRKLSQRIQRLEAPVDQSKCPPKTDSERRKQQLESRNRPTSTIQLATPDASTRTVPSPSLIVPLLK